MRKLALTIGCLILTFIAASLSAQEEVQISSNQVSEYLRRALEKYAQPDSTRWADRMYRLLIKNGDVEATVKALAQEDGMSAANEKALISFWFAYSDSFRGDRRETPEQREAGRQQLWRQGLSIVRASGHHITAVKVVVGATMSRPRCDLEPFEEVLAGASNTRDIGIAAAETAWCTPWWLALHARFPNDVTILTSLSRNRDIPFATRLAFLEAWAGRQPDSQDARISMIQEYASALWEAGLIPEGFAVLDSASTRDRRQLLNQDGSGDRSNDFRLEYIAALHISGKTAQARSEFERLSYTKEFRSLWDCLGKRFHLRQTDPEPCNAMQSGIARKWQVLESLLNRPSEDPYLLIEGGGSVGYESGLWTEAMRRLLTGDNYAFVRRSFAEGWVRGRLTPPSSEIAAMQTRFVRSDLLTAADSFEKKMRAAAAPWNVPLTVDHPAPWSRAATPPPLPQGVRELPLPETFRTESGKQSERMSWPMEMSPLPEGFRAVRVERGTPWTIAISLSQNVDPVGEVSQGGYWIHLSRDQGSSWEPALYTGLLEVFPYVVLPTSKMPMLSGDRIELEVAVKELDPSSIFYPPVALRSRRQASDLYLEIPLSTLQSDRDRDGLTDILEERLLLDPDRADTDGDGIIDGMDPLPNIKNAPPSLENAYIKSVFDHLLKAPQQAIVEAVDRQSLIQFTPASPPSLRRPIFVAGRAEDFASLAIASMVLVYSEADIARLSAHSPDFHPVRLTPAVFNRARDRGYISYNLGWTGGTLRLIRAGDSWRVEVISSWVT